MAVPKHPTPIPLKSSAEPVNTALPAGTTLNLPALQGPAPSPMLSLFLQFDRTCPSLSL